MHTGRHEGIRQSGSAAPTGSLSRALLQGLETPIAALRASMESLKQEVWHGNSPGAPSFSLDGVLREVELIGRNVQELCAFAASPVPNPLSCSLDEIVSAARLYFAPAQQARVFFARHVESPRIRVDGPLLSSCLRRLIENALEACEDAVLVVARIEGEMACFSVFDGAPSAFHPGWQPALFQTTKPNHLGLGLALTQRDVALLNGRLEFLSTSDGDTYVRISIPTKETDR